MRTRFFARAAAGLLLVGVGLSQPAYAAGAGARPKPEAIPHVQTGRAVPIPEFFQPDGPWATPPQPVKAARGPILNDEFCSAGTPDLATVCLDLKQLLRNLPFGA